MIYKSILLRVEDGISTITLNIPNKMNAMTLEMADEIMDALKRSSQDDEVRVIVITGNGRAFSVGADLNSPIFEETSVVRLREIIMRFQQIPLTIRNTPKPVIASVNGVAAGGGCNLALACDVIIASEDARFVEGFPNIGLHCDTGGIYFVPRLIGYTKACEFLMTRQILSAQEAERIGLINHVVPKEQLESETKKLAQTLADGPPVALRLLKSSINQAMQMELCVALEHEADAHTFCFLTEDSKEGVKAFLEKKKPVFKGK